MPINGTFDWYIDGTDVMSLSSTGCLGIGTTPSSQNNLVMYSNKTNTSNQLKIQAGQNYANIKFVNDYSIAGYIGVGCSNIAGNYSNNLYLQADSNIVLNSGSDLTTSTPTMIMKSNGYVGIGTTNPSSLLTVNGTSYLSGNVGIGTTPASTLNLYVYGNYECHTEDQIFH